MVMLATSTELAVRDGGAPGAEGYYTTGTVAIWIIADILFRRRKLLPMVVTIVLHEYFA